MTAHPATTAVYNSFWSTGGGAETYGGAVAELLSRDGPVELIGHAAFDPAALGERLSLDLSRCSVRVVPQSSRAVTEASREVDLFVNVSHRSRDLSQAARSLYVVHFPTAFGVGTGTSAVAWGTGFHLPEPRVTWTDGAGELLVTADPDRPVDVTVRLGFSRPEPTQVSALIDGVEVAATRLAGPRSPWERWAGRALRFRVPGSSGPVAVVLASDTFVPGNGDGRVLGVPVTGVGVGRSSGSRVQPRASTAWLDSYDALVANSVFTSGWVERLWDRPSAVLHPPVSLRTPGRKQNVILSVGRFFPRDRGHSKKQLELVRAFRQLVDGGLRDWTLHLAGGCAPAGRAYLDAVRADAEGYPVELHPDLSGTELDALYARASVYWHAAGLGEDEQRHPERLEHFGISTVEAMSAGAVPVVIGRGGLVETVRDGVDGFVFADVDGLVERTRRLVDDPALRAKMAASAGRRAEEFSLPAFDQRLHALLDGLAP